MKLSQQAQRELSIMFLSFGFFTTILEYNNGKVDDDFRDVFLGVKFIIEKEMKRNGNAIIKRVNKLSQSIARDFTMDMALASVSVIAMYYESVKRPLFSPMSWAKIREVQNTYLDIDYQIEKNTLDYCEALVQKILTH